MAKTLTEWAKTQVRKPTDKISAFDKLRAPFIINEYETWGELYDAVGIKPPVGKPKPVKFNVKGRTKEDISNDVDVVYSDVEYARMQMQGLKTTDPDYAENKKLFDESSKKLKELRAEYASFEAKEDSKKLQDDITKKKDEIKKKEDFGDDATKAKADLKKLKETKAATDKKILVPTTTAKTADEARAQGTQGAQGATPAPTPTPTPTPTPGVPTTKAPRVPTTKAPVVTDAQQREEALNVAAEEDFVLPETIFNNVDSLKRILERYVKEDWTPDKLRKAIRDDVWFRKNSAEIKARYVQLYNYQDLVKTGQAQGTTDYEKQITTLERQIADKARAMGSGIASDPAALRKAAENMYITNVGIDDAMTTDFIAAAIRPIGSTIGGKPTLGYSGQALKDYQELQSVARANGFKISDIIPGRQTEEQVLQGIATGRIDANRIAQDARRLAAQGRPEYVRDLLSQGYNLDQVYSPYRQTMANILELNPDQIDLNDPTLQSGISDTGDMNLFDFKKALRKDSRWQYTGQAKEEVADIALRVLKDFGFQG